MRIESIEEVGEQDWVRVTQAQFGPCRITPGFWIVPTWADIPADARQVIRLDPGLAFGTGTHPTTRMCLRWIAGHGGDDGRRLAARPRLRLRLGRPRDRRAQVRRASRRRRRHRPGGDRGDARERARQRRRAARRDRRKPRSGRYQLVLANILATPLKLLAPLLSARLDAGGQLVLAGILERQADELRAAYSPWLDLDVADQDDGWILLVGSRPRGVRMA